MSASGQASGLAAEERGAGARPARGGSALVAVLWAVGLLGMIVAAFAFDAHIESRITSYYRRRRQAEYLARSGVEVARMLMDRSWDLRQAEDEQLAETEPGSRWDAPAGLLARGAEVAGWVAELGAGTIELSIVPEPARRNVNLLKEDDWERIFDVCGVPMEFWPELVDSFFDWTDKDDVPRRDGAETDYYQTLDPPYSAKNAPLDTVGELLLVRGFNRAIVFGGVLRRGVADDEGVSVRGIADLLTVYGDGKVNVNAASSNVLMTLPGVDELVAGAIVEEREGWLNERGEREGAPFRSVQDVLGRIPGLDASFQEHITTDSKIYRVTSVGEVYGVKRRVWCIVEHGRDRLKFYRWSEDE